MLLSGAFASLASIGGLVLLLTLLSYDQDGYRSWFQSTAFSAVCSFCCVLASGAAFQLLAARGEIHLANGRWSTQWMPIGFVFATAVFLGIDRIRMSSREPLEMRQARRATAPQPCFIPRAVYTPAPPPNIATSEPPRPAEEVPQASAEQAAPAPQATVHAATMHPTTPVPLDTSVPEVTPKPPVPAPAASAPMPSQPVAPEPVRAEPGPTLVAHAATPAIPPGKEATIYVSLVGEGMNVLRSVRAEHLTKDFYRIIETVPEGETWEFQPGQVVRCKKKNLSGGKALVAIEEAPKAHA